jgi:hypothetical protein
MPTRSSATILTRGIVLALTAAASAAANSPAPQPRPATRSGAEAPTAPSQLPPLRPGLWEYRRTVYTAADSKPRKTTFQVCADPNAEIRERLETLRRKGCVFSPVLTRGKQYQSSWRCPVSSGVLVDHNIMLVADDSSYQDDNEIRSGEHFTRSRLVATRVGECPAGMHRGEAVQSGPRPDPRPPR